jgi:pantothenate kinase
MVTMTGAVTKAVFGKPAAGLEPQDGGLERRQVLDDRDLDPRRGRVEVVVR